MNTASLGRRLGDWLGIVPDDEITLAEDTVPAEVADGPEESSPGRQPAAVDHVVVDSGPVATATSRPRVRRVAPTAEFRAEIIAWRAAVNELRAGLDLDEHSDEHHSC